MSASRLATTLDQEMLGAHHVVIASHTTPDSQLPLKTGRSVASELGGRLLLRYLIPSQLGAFDSGSVGRQHWVTPTPYSPQDASVWLALWNGWVLRRFVMLLDPGFIPHIKGPRWIRFGHGIEYLLPNGFPQVALMPVPVLPVT
jgi:hypothetical protein